MAVGKNPREHEKQPPHVMSPAELAEHDRAKLERSVEALRAGDEYDAAEPLGDPDEAAPAGRSRK